MHYSMIVAAENFDSLTRRLTPFQRNDEGKCPPQYMTFIDASAEYRAAWQGETRRRVQIGDDLVSLGDDRLAGWSIFGDCAERDGQCLPVIDVPISQIYPSVEAWMEADGYLPNSEGKYGYWDNPSGQWIDWTVGGRWSGWLDGYDPAENPVNFTPCHICDGTGDRPGWVSYVCIVPGPDRSLNTFRGPKREQVVLAAAEYIRGPAPHAPHDVTRRRARKLVAEPFDPEQALAQAGVTIDRCFTDAHAEYHGGCDLCRGQGKIRAPFNAPHPGDSLIAGTVDWEAVKDRQAARAARRWDLAQQMKADKGSVRRASIGTPTMLAAIFTGMEIEAWQQAGGDRETYIAAQREQAATHAFLGADGKWSTRENTPDFDARFWAFVQAIPQHWVVYMLDIYTQ